MELLIIIMNTINILLCLRSDSDDQLIIQYFLLLIILIWLNKSDILQQNPTRLLRDFTPEFFFF